MDRVKPKTYRFKDNPDEEVFYNTFLNRYLSNDNDNNLNHVIFGARNGGRGRHPADYLTVHEQDICLNLIQWLGSPVGQAFLRDCGFEKCKS